MFFEPSRSHLLVNLAESTQDHLAELQTEEMCAKARKGGRLNPTWRRLEKPRLFDPSFDPDRTCRRESCGKEKF
jgi:hypothetical protein